MALSHPCALLMQLVTLDKSQFSGALVRIPSGDLTDLEPDWEIDPAGLIIMDKLGMVYLLQSEPFDSCSNCDSRLKSACYIRHTWRTLCAVRSVAQTVAPRPFREAVSLVETEPIATRQAVPFVSPPCQIAQVNSAVLLPYR